MHRYADRHREKQQRFIRPGFLLPPMSVSIQQLKENAGRLLAASKKTRNGA
jgi:hypothetical protein